jgi:hypothetical protein
MAKQGVNKINGLRQRWLVYQLLADVVWAIAIALLGGSLLFHLLSVPAIATLLIFVIALAVMLIMHRPWLISNEAIAGYLNKEYPELQESTDLISATYRAVKHAAITGPFTYRSCFR